MSDNEFYIGWQRQAPRIYSKYIRNVVMVLFVLVSIAAVAMALSQKKFRSGNFEFGKLTELKGIYFNEPVPCIKVISAKDVWGKVSSVTIPLVGFGKSGADGIISDIEKVKGFSLNQKEIILKGTLLYNDGKLLMQVDAKDRPVTKIGRQVTGPLLTRKEDLGAQKLKGEIVDPKCFFGVMKPGEGKPHKDCAIRCILGGIPPVLKVKNENGDENYHLIVGPRGEKMNQALKNYIAQPVELHARVIKYDDWTVLYMNDHNSVNRIAGPTFARPGAQVLACVGSH